MLQGKSWKTTAGGIILLLGGAFLLYRMITGLDVIDSMHIVLLSICLGGGGALTQAKDNNIHTVMTIDNKGENITVK